MKGQGWYPVKVIADRPPDWWVCSTLIVPNGEVSWTLVRLTRWRGCGVDHRSREAANKHCTRLERAARKGAR